MTDSISPAPGAATRTERDSMGPLEVPADAPWGAQTQRAIQNFGTTGGPLPAPFIQALARIKAAAARVNAGLGLLDADVAQAIEAAAGEVVDGKHADAFPLAVFQTGSGTSTNMNANEVLAHLASAASGQKVHPNDHVNAGQSSNDTIPSATYAACAIVAHERLLPALDRLVATLKIKAESLHGVVKTGRTHLMDAMPVRFDQELGAWAAMVAHSASRLRHLLATEVQHLPQGGTAVGTGINAHPEFGERVCAELSRETGVAFVPAEDLFRGLSSLDPGLAFSGELKTLSTSLIKVANDLRWMNSGPLAGLAEIQLPALQPGSSIMPGKVNPVIPEVMCMVAAQVIGMDTANTLAAQSGSFQLNVMWPLLATNLVRAQEYLAEAVVRLADDAIAGFTVNQAHIDEALGKNPILITAANAVIGYEKGAKVAKRAYAEKRPVLDVAHEETGLSGEELAKLLDPARLTEGGIVEGGGGAGG